MQGHPVITSGNRKPLHLQGQNPEEDLGSGIWLKEGRILGSLKVPNLIRVVNNFGQLPFDAGSSSETMLVIISRGELKNNYW